ncbi:MAG TPA: TonB-dependent receptor plug domain-containing protein, partial [Thermoanaerobaculia bacterium]|nr:TonB-dependent receptor plug domain-containing protein [Thermoanaerobaculia bacterium]
MPPAALVALLLPLRLLAGDEPASASAPPPTAHEEITVTATAVPTRLAETPAAVTLLDEDELVAAAPLTLDDLLRQVPGFTLFRRTGSRSANPTTQGASLRGIGGSGASRALVLADGIPLNDPFGGWVAWGRVPRLSLVRVEVLRGGASELYGSGALAGVVQLLRRPAGLPGDGGSLLAEGSAGGERTASGGLWAAGRYGAWGASLAREGVTSAGYVPVARTERGPVDSPAGGRHRSVELTVERAAATGVRLFARGSGFDEHRANGTPLQENSTWLRELAAGLDHSLGGGAAAWRLWSTRERYFQTFSTVAADRASERLNRDQRVPSRVVGGTLRWTRPLGDRQTLVAGAETRKTRGESDERAFVGG